HGGRPRAVAHRRTVPGGRPLHRGQQSGHDPGQGRLARPVGPEHQQALAGTDREVDAPQGPPGPRGTGGVDVPHVLEPDHGAAPASPPRTTRGEPTVTRRPPARATTTSAVAMPQTTSSRTRTPSTWLSGHWNTMAVPPARPSAAAPVRTTRPDATGLPASTRAKVDLPDPLSPTTATSVPGSTRRFTSDRASEAAPG